MDDKTFWKIVDSIEWPTIADKENSTELSKKRAKELYGDKNKEWFNEVYKKIREKENELNLLLEPLWLNEWPLFVSDDSYWDLKAHIVGCGKQAFEKALLRPETVFDDYVVNNNYHENFEYWTHIKI